MPTEISWISKTKGAPRTGHYQDADDFSSLPVEKILAICAFCYSIKDKKWVLVYNGSNIIRNWEPVAGHIEPGETPEEALVREIKEESNMKVLEYFPLGYLYVNETDFFQVQYLCLVEPYGPFVRDQGAESSDHGVTAIKLVDFDEIPKYLTKNDTSRATLNRCETVFKKLELNND